ncbi:hypothetical protein D3C76_981420 [compost metagenome]
MQGHQPRLPGQVSKERGEGRKGATQTQLQGEFKVVLRGRRFEYLQLFDGHLMGLGQAGQGFEHSWLVTPHRQLPAGLLQSAAHCCGLLDAAGTLARRLIGHFGCLRHQRPQMQGVSQARQQCQQPCQHHNLHRPDAPCHPTPEAQGATFRAATSSNAWPSSTALNCCNSAELIKGEDERLPASCATAEAD